MNQMITVNRDFETLREPLAQLGVQWGSVEPFFETFAPHRVQPVSVSVDSLIGSIGLMVRGAGQPYIYQVARFMEEVGMPEPSIQRFLARAKYFDGQNASFSIHVDHRGIRECSTKFSSPIGIDVAHAFLADSGVGAHGVGLMAAVAELLNQESVHAVATCAAASGHLTERVWFELNDSEMDWENVRSAGLLCGLSDSDWAPLDAHRSNLAMGRQYASIEYRQGQAISGIKLYFEAVLPDIVAGILGTQLERDRADSMRAVLGRSVHDRVGCRLIPGSPIVLTTHNAG